ncbi:tryptophan synthase subunit alpha [Brevibacillus humidisoli]|uniref:tryptophan synthase subunit alpha n=1 Tax=Brevibacillus humidisoli TaxID=2895522 RepID=UPI001E2CF5AF|nr:tryptophan synthase subunit alpha [Brevibacillus humidisoli]UFJ39792.1 tryptophan synthase subunit alpha [Brevibacillus humidisoli]
MSSRFHSNRMMNTYEMARNRNEAMIVGYFIAADPDLPQAINIAAEAVAAGVDVLEIGVPSPNPFLEGNIIRRGHQRVQQLSPDTRDLTIRYCTQLRERVDVPMWLMGYSQDIVDSGLYRELADKQVIDGLVLPDAPRNVLTEVEREVGSQGVDVVRLVHSQMDQDELRETVSGATVLYAQLYTGTTGDFLSQSNDLNQLYTRVRSLSEAMVVAGFGIRSAERVREVTSGGYDGAVVGSAYVAKVERGEMDSLYQLIADMKIAARRPGKLLSK